MDLPESLVQEETQRLVYETVRSGAARGAREQEIVQHKQEIFEGAGRTAAQTVKWRYLAQRIAEAEKIEATDDDLRARIEMMAAAYGQKPDALRAQLEKNDRLDWIRRGIVQNKVMDFLRREAVVEAGV